MVFDSKQFLRDGSTNLTASASSPAASGANKGPIALMTGLPRAGMWLKAYTKSQITGTNSVNTIHSTTPPTGGTYTLTLGGQTTAALAFNATTAAVQTALAGLATATTPVYLNGRNYYSLIAGTDIVVSGSAISAGDMVFTAGGVLQAQPLVLTATFTSLTGNTATAITNGTPGMDIVIQGTDGTNVLASSGSIHINGATAPFQEMAVLIEGGQSFNVTGGQPLTSFNYSAVVTGTPVNAPVVIVLDQTMGGQN